MSLFSTRRRTARLNTTRRWLQFETMEERQLMAVYAVQTRGSSTPTGDGSLQNPFSTITQAVDAAKLNPGADEIQVGFGGYDETVTIADTADLTIRGGAVRPILFGSIQIVQPLTTTVVGQQTTTTKSNASFLIENININSATSAGIFVNPLLPGDNLGPTRQLLRGGSVTLNSMQVTVPAVGTAWNNIAAFGLNQFSANNLVLNNGRTWLNDINTASISQFTVNTSKTNALAANFVNQLNVVGLVASQPAATGIQLTNPTRTLALDAPSVVNLTSVEIVAAGGNGVEAGNGISLNATNSTFKFNAGDGLSLNSVTATTLNNVDSNNNSRHGFSIVSSTNGPRTVVTGTSLFGNSNRASGLNAQSTGSITIVGALLSNNVGFGIFSDQAAGSLDLTSIQANNNGQFGSFLRDMSGNVIISSMRTNDNLLGGTSISQTRVIATTFPIVGVYGLQSMRNGQIGLSIVNSERAIVGNAEASDNKGLGLYMSPAVGAVSIDNSVFNRNSLSTTSSIKSGALITGLITGLRMFNVTANNNPTDGINIDNIFGTIDASNIFASGNGVSGLYVNNQGQPQRADLLLGFSNLSGNGKNGLLANGQSKVVISRSSFDNNGPVATQAVDFGTGAWIQNTGAGGVSIEDSTAIGTRVGVQTGGGMLIANATGPEVQIRRVTINNTVVHPLTTTSFGAGLVVTGSTPGVRIEDSTLNHNLLADAIAQRATVFATVPIAFVRSQLLDNAGVSIEAASSLSVQDSTIARTTGIGLRTANGGTILRSTLSGNTSEAVISSGAMLIDQSTLTGNATAINSSSPTKVIQNSGALTLHNSIVAGNGVDSWAFANSASATSIGFNLLSGTPIGWTGQASDIVGDVNNGIDPLLGALTNNGGPTLTHMPLAGSPALETGDLNLNGSNDQRGALRPQGQTATPKVDIGAVEAAPIGNAPTILLNSRSTSVNEGNLLTMRGKVSDFDGNFTSLVASVGTVQLLADRTFLWTLVTSDDLSVSVTLTATDVLGGVGTATFTAIANNVAPTLSASYAADPISRMVNLDATAIDRSLADRLTFTVNWGDGTSDTYGNKPSGRQLFSHVYGAVWPSAIVVSVADDDGASAPNVSLAINVQPIIELDTTTATGVEGSNVRLTGRVIDLDGNMGQLVASRGSVQLNADGTFVWTEFGVDDANYPVILTARDTLNATSTKSLTAQVNNVVPILGLVTDTLDMANNIITIRSSVADVGLADSHRFLIQWGDGTSETIPDLSGSRLLAMGHQYASIAGPISISVQAVDDDGGLSQVTTITANVAPSIQVDSNSVSGTEGSPVTLTGRGIDLDSDLTSITATLGSVQLNADGTFVWGYTGNDDLSNVVTLTAMDSFGNVGSASFTVQIVNAAPSLGTTSKTLNTATRTVTLNTSVIDPGSSDTHLVTIQWGDGTTSTATPAADRSVTASHQYAAVGAIAILVSAADDDGASSPFSEVIANVVPTIQLSATTISGNEGSQLRLTGFASDADGNLVSLTSTVGSVQLNADGSFVWTYNGVDDVSNRTVETTATDAFGAVARASFTVTVNNVAPTLGTTSANLSIATRTVTVSTSVIDVGLADTHLFTIQWGDGTSSTVAPAANRTLTVSHLYTAFGPTLITVKATDDEGASSASTSLTQVIPGFVVRNRELFVYGSNLADSISFGAPNRGQVTASANFGGISNQFIFSSTAIDNVLGYLGAGNDVWSGNLLQENQFVFGEAGNDQITTGALDDILVGGDGADTLNAGAGGDLLFGGLGADTLSGQDGSDVLVAGRYDRENDFTALRMLRTAWIGTGTYQTRVGRMRSGVGTDTQGLVVKLSISQITDDAIDQLFGGNDTDWYLTNSATEVRGGTRDESTN